MPFHFFTDPGSLQPQTPQQKYGPVQGNESTQWRVTSLFASSGSSPAYAVCDGKVFAQEFGGRINLVLRPTEQPPGTHSAVRYYVYKGLQKSFLVDAASTGFIAVKTKSTLTAKIHESQESRNKAYDKLLGQSDGTTTTKPTINAVGLHLTAAAASPDKLADTALLDDVYLRLDDDEFPSVKGGDDLGAFDPAGFGFEIILDGHGEGTTLKELRNVATVITAAASASGPVSEFKRDDERERILNYIDPCAFYASFFYSGLRVKKSPTRGLSLHTNVLSKFGTSDVVYLDIRNEHNHALNYYRNYNPSTSVYAPIHLRLNGGSKAPHDYHTHGWPIYTIPVASFTGTSAKVPSTISLNLPQGDNDKPILFLLQGYFHAKFKRMSQAPDTTEALRRHVAFQSDTFTEPVALAIPKLPDNTTIPFHIQLRYVKRIKPAAPAPSPGERVLTSRHFVDDLFELTSLLGPSGPKIPLDTNAIARWHLTGTTAIVDPGSTSRPAYVVNVGIAVDQNLVWFFAASTAANLVAGTVRNFSFIDALSKAHGVNPQYGSVEFQTAPILRVLTCDGLPADIAIPAFGDNDFDADSTKMTGLVIHTTELPAIISAMGTLEPAFDKRLVLRSPTGNTVGTEYNLYVLGYKFGTTVTVTAVDTQIKIHNCHTTPRFLSSDKAAVTFNPLDPVAINSKRFAESKIPRGSIVRLRLTPRVPLLSETPNLAAITRGERHPITVLGKTRVLNDNKDETGAEKVDRTWYYIELLEGIVLIDRATKKTTTLQKGERYWIGAGLSIVCPFEQFITDLVDLNEVIDGQQATPEGLLPRLTRLRRRTKEAGAISNLFDSIIGAPPIGPPSVVRLNAPGSYVSGAQVVFGPISALDTKIQLFEDYMEAKLGNGKVIDLHHLFVGMDVVNYENPDAEVDVDQIDSFWTNFMLDMDLGNNIDMTTWAGDIGAIPADFNVPNSKAKVQKFGADHEYQDFWFDAHPGTTKELIDLAFLEHYWETRAKDEDLLPDVYCHLVHARLKKVLLTSPTDRNLPALLYHFNRQLVAEGDRQSFQIFCRRLGFEPMNPHPYRLYPTVVTKIIDSINAFAGFWFNYRFERTVILSGAGPWLHAFSEQLTTKFISWLERHR